MHALLETKLKSNVDEMCFISRQNNLNDQCTCYNPLTGLTLNSLWIKKLQFLLKINLFPSKYKQHNQTTKVLT